jgi:apolipoprotein N-acyltransferase
VQGDERPGLLVNVTNDGWFGNTTGPRQHFHQSRVRAVEEGLPLIRAANNGISAAVDGYGRVLARLDMNVRGAIDVPVAGCTPSPTLRPAGGLGVPLPVGAWRGISPGLVAVNRFNRISNNLQR